MDFQIWLTFLITALAISLSPGNGAIVSMSHGLAYGFAASRYTVLGLQAAMAAMMLVASLGVGQLLLSSPTFFLVLKWLGAAYLCWLGIIQWREAGRQDIALTDVAATRTFSPRALFWQGFATATSNPKGLIFLIAIVPQFIHQDRGPLIQALVLTATMVAVDTFSMLGYAYLAARLAQWLHQAHIRRLLSRCFGTVLIVVGLSVVIA